jgi:hypothetical protein
VEIRRYRQNADQDGCGCACDEVRTGTKPKLNLKVDETCFSWLSFFVQSKFLVRSSVVNRIYLFILGVPIAVLPVGVGGCGLSVPEKYVLTPDRLDQSTNLSSGGNYEDMIIQHIYCEIAVGLKKAYVQVKTPESNKQVQLNWLSDWGTAITLAITAEDQSGLNPGLSLTMPFENRVFTFPTGGNVTSPQSFNFGIGGSASTSATRSETIQFTYTNEGLLQEAEYLLKEQPNFDKEQPDYDDACKFLQSGVMIDSDLKIWEFIYDKAVIAAQGNAAAWVHDTGKVQVPVLDKCGKPVPDCSGNSTMKWVYKPHRNFNKHPSWPLYNTFTENITFTATFGGNVTPTWKLARLSVNGSGTLLSATRTNTNQLTITMGPIGTQPSAMAAAQLKQNAQTQHDNTVLSNQIKTPID